MRLHSLSVTAFGPFASTVDVDFDTLSQAGLFLLSGATGAGKTSVLDAICFALYGEVPGDRNSAKRLRSDQAPAGVRPTVVLEVSMSGRRLRLTRSPTWERAKKRGSGTMSEQASVIVQESVGKEWVTRTTRADEAGHFVTGLLGMTLTQFCQVALLPQGRFQSFLRARSEERQQLLQQLFRTQRFSDIESWLAEHRRQLRRDSAAVQEEVLAVVNRLCEAAGVDESPDIESSPSSLDALHRWAEVLLDQAQSARGLAQQRVETIQAEVSAATEAYRLAQEKFQLRAAYDQARHEEAELTLASQANEQALARLDRDTRAASLSPLLTLTQQSAQGLLRASEALIETGALAGTATSTTMDPDLLPTLEAALGDAAAQLAELKSLGPTASELRRLLREQDKFTGEAAALNLTIEAALVSCESAEGDVARLQVQLSDALTAAQQADDLEKRRLANAALSRAHSDYAEVSHLLKVATSDVNDMRVRALSLKQDWLQIRESRLDGMAAEIASCLVVGGSCPVCGSADHPNVAQAVLRSPDASTERKARSALDDAEAEMIAFQDRHRDLTIKSAVLTEKIGDSTAVECHAAGVRLAHELKLAVARASSHDQHQGDLLKAKAQLADTIAAVQHARTRLSQLEGKLDQLAPVISRLQNLLEVTLKPHDGASLDEARENVAALLGRLQRALAAAQDWSNAHKSHQQHHDSLRKAAFELGFSDPDAVPSEILSPQARAITEAQVASYESRRRNAQQILDSAPHQRAATGDAPDPAGAQSRLGSARRSASQAEAQLSTSHAREARLSELQISLQATLRQWRPVISDLELAIRISSLAEGSTADNAVQMRLSAYVLAYRLSQVVAAANERLVAMSDQRYCLEHSLRRGAGERRGGLSLLVRDDWSGESRDPATLSGGETFVVSLALALGLADVIAHEVGGADLDTLFVDEGFGALDSDTLDDVMDTLDALRAGGRVVGVVSHVAEMRHRIPTRLHVTKHRTGSTLSLVHGH